MPHTSVAHVILSRRHAHTRPRLAEENLQKSHNHSMSLRLEIYMGWAIPSAPLHQSELSTVDD